MTPLPKDQALQGAEHAENNVQESLIDFKKAAEQGGKSTESIWMTERRAARLGEHNVGQLDPATTSANFILKVFADTLAGRSARAILAVD